MKVILAEKPDIAVKFASVIGGVILPNGEELQFKHVNDKAYEDQIKKARSRGYFESKKGYWITYAYGHMYELKKPDEYVPDLKQGWKTQLFPIIPSEMVDCAVKSMYKPKSTDYVKNQAKIVTELFKKADTIINATDADREGESIFRIPFIMSGVKKKFYRIWITDQTEDKIRKSLHDIKEGVQFDSVWYAGISRAISDWLVGMNLTGVNVAHTRNMVHIGRVKCPTLALIVQRDLEIDNFRKETHFAVIGEFGSSSGIYKGELNLEPMGLDKMKDKKQAEEVIKDIQSEKQGIITQYESKREKTEPPLLYSNTTLTGDAGDYFNFKMDETLSISQSLYDKGFISYPRTDSQVLPESIEGDLSVVLKNLSGIRTYQKFVKPYRKPSKRYINDDKQSGSSHYAIIPTTMTPDFSKMTENEKKIYHLIVLRFLCMFQDPALFDKVKIVTKIKDFEFVSNGKTLKQSGWLDLYPSNRKDISLPLLKVQKRVVLNQLEIAERETQPPKPYSTKTLANVMENVSRLVDDKQAKEILKEAKGLGTPATRSGIIAELEKGGYIVQAKNAIRSTPKGKDAIRHLKDLQIEELISPLLTAEWESKLKDIEKGTADYRHFITSIVGFVENSTLKIKSMKVSQSNYLSSSPRTGGTGTGTTSTTHSTTSSPSKGRVKQGMCGFCRDVEIKKNSKAYYCPKCKRSVFFTGLQSRGLNEIDQKTAYKLFAKQKVILSFTSKNSKAYEAEVKLLDGSKLDVQFVKK